MNPHAFFLILKGDLPKADLEVKLSLYGGFQNILDKHFMIIEEFNSLYLECEQVPHAQAYTVCTVVQLLKEIYQIMEKEELLEWTVVIAKNASILKLFGSAISNYRKGKFYNEYHFVRLLFFDLNFSVAVYFQWDPYISCN